MLEAALMKIKEFSATPRRRLLVVEDNPAEQMTIRELLGYDDVDVHVASTGAEALAKICSALRIAQHVGGKRAIAAH